MSAMEWELIGAALNRVAQGEDPADVYINLYTTIASREAVVAARYAS